MSETETKIATKKKVLIDCRVVADFSSETRWCKTKEAAASVLEGCAREFNCFIRDHRSQDDIRLEVERIYEDQCSVCGRAWELLPADADGPECCASCGTPTKAPEPKETA